MKCKICGHRTNSLQSMNKHYSEAHPGRKRKRKLKVQNETARVTETGGVMIMKPGQPLVVEPILICPNCGQSIRVSKV